LLPPRRAALRRFTVGSRAAFLCRVLTGTGAKLRQLVARLAELVLGSGSRASASSTLRV
jgi:hypothetical protein